MWTIDLISVISDTCPDKKSIEGCISITYFPLVKQIFTTFVFFMYNTDII